MVAVGGSGNASSATRAEGQVYLASMSLLLNCLVPPHG
jgi:hypothetical protein